MKLLSAAACFWMACSCPKPVRISEINLGILVSTSARMAIKKFLVVIFFLKRDQMPTLRNNAIKGGKLAISKWEGRELTMAARIKAMALP